MSLLARHEEINAWLDQHPAVLGGIFLVLGLALVGYGLKALLTGQSRSKHGHQLEGPTAYAHGAVLAIGGVICTIFALYKLLTALL